jgi:hypothetical protein
MSRRNRSFTRVIIPDFHGEHIDKAAARACVADIKRLRPKSIIFLGDGLDAAGLFNSHQRSFTNELVETFDADCVAANRFIDQVQHAAPDVEEIDFIEGNHEQHIDRWIARNFTSHRDATNLLEVYGPKAVLDLKRRGIKYYDRQTCYQGLSIPGTIKRGRCYFTHGISFAKHAASVHLARFGDNVVFGHVHRSMSVIERTVTSDGFGAWCPGTLAKLQPLYAHTAPTSWSHGYAVQLVEASGRFLHINVPIHKGKSLLVDLTNRLAA